jgi:predicted SAM-dependent methyltransferase
MSYFIFEEAEYLAANPDVATAVIDGKFYSGREHYELYGEREGRRLNRLILKTSREDKVFHLLDKTGLGLEIGPSHNPIAPKNKGFNVHILDHASAAEIRDKYQGHGVNLDNIEEVDFVWQGESLQELIGKTSCYDWIIASHVIEHVPDLISYLQQCEALLKPDGILSLVIPDKRYCFDYFSSSSSTGNVLDAYAEKRVKPSHGQVFDHIANASKRNGNIAWGADDLGGADELVHTFAEAQAHWVRSVSTTDYIDVHCWRFTPASFRLLISDLQGLGLIGLKIEAEFDTTGCEFYVALAKCSDVPMKLDRLSTLQFRKLENA